MCLTSTQTFLNGTIGDIRTAEGSICDWTFKWIQDGNGSCEPKAGDVRIYSPRMGFLPLWQMPKCYITVRAQLWDEKGDRMTDFEGTMYADGELEP
jgi:hypothetical protein